MNQCLANLYKRRVISLDNAFGRSSDPDELRNLIATDESRAQAQRKS
jgi:twitching motility protein PilT